MKRLAIVLVLGAAVFFTQRRNANDAASRAAIKAAATSKSLAPRATTPVAKLRISGPRPSNHDWAKHSLDRAQEAVEKVQQARQEEDQP